MLVVVPFVGFYNSILDCECEVIDIINGYADEYNLSDDVCSRLDFDIDRDGITKMWLKLYCDQFYAEYEIDLNAKFVKIDSPQYYNFETDKLIADIDLSILKQCLKTADKQGFSDYVYDRMMPRDGFIPFYSNRIKSWGHEDMWDGNQWSLLLDYLTNDYMIECIEGDIYGELFQFVSITDESRELIKNAGVQL